jgi:hypothetical protein
MASYPIGKKTFRSGRKPECAGKPECERPAEAKYLFYRVIFLERPVLQDKE